MLPVIHSRSTTHTQICPTLSLCVSDLGSNGCWLLLWVTAVSRSRSGDALGALPLCFSSLECFLSLNVLLAVLCVSVSPHVTYLSMSAHSPSTSPHTSLPILAALHTPFALAATPV